MGQVQKTTVLKTRPDFIAEDESSDKDELTRKVHDLALSCTGTVVQQQFTINLGTVWYHSLILGSNSILEHLCDECQYINTKAKKTTAQLQQQYFS